MVDIYPSVNYQHLSFCLGNLSIHQLFPLAAHLLQTLKHTGHVQGYKGQVSIQEDPESYQVC